MKITADTITDEQIRELRDILRDPDVWFLCQLATRSDRDSIAVARARARCAEILNARNHEK